MKIRADRVGRDGHRCDGPPRPRAGAAARGGHRGRSPRSSPRSASARRRGGAGARPALRRAAGREPAGRSWPDRGRAGARLARGARGRCASPPPTSASSRPSRRRPSCAPCVVELESGQRVEVGASPVASAGAYAPGGRGSYPSSVLMAALPARAAGVPRFVVVSPASASGRPDDAVLAACAVAGSRGGLLGRRRAGDRRPRARDEVDSGGRRDCRAGQPLRHGGEAVGRRAGSGSTASRGPANSR